MIPNIYHFIFGLTPDFGGKPFDLVHYISIKSCININNPNKVFIYYEFEPETFWWFKIKEEKNVELVKVKAPSEFLGCKIHHVAHKADVIRLQKLYEYGGVYMDLDTVSVKKLHNFYNEKCVIGSQLEVSIPVWKYYLNSIVARLKGKNPGQIRGLCNAVILAEKQSEFIKYWLDSYKNFRSTGHDTFWDEHSVLVPKKLAAEYPSLITILSPFKFHYPLYFTNDLKQLFVMNKKFRNAFVHHLWESRSWDDYLKKLTVSKIFEEDNTYNKLSRKHLDKKLIIESKNEN